MGLGSRMSQKDEPLDTKSDKGTEEQSVSRGSMDEKVGAQPEKSPPGSGQNTHNLSVNRRSQKSGSPTKRATEKVELDLEGLKGKPPAAQPARPSPVSSKGKGRRPAVAVSVIVAVLLGASWFSYEYAKSRKKEKKPAGVSDQSVLLQQDSPPFFPIDSYHFYGLAPFFVPIPVEQIGREGFLKVTLTLAFKDDVPSGEIEKKILMIRGKITDMLLGKSLSELQSGEGKIRLKSQVKDLLNTTLPWGTVQDVYFDEFYIL